MPSDVSRYASTDADGGSIHAIWIQRWVETEIIGELPYYPYVPAKCR